jgi:class 3 adenylate cyclase
LRAIATLDGARTAQPAPVVAGTAAAASFAAELTSAAATSPQAPSSPAATRAAGERRYLTAMFCDLVGSTAMSAQLDAEEWRDLVGAYLDAASTAVAQVGGGPG